MDKATECYGVDENYLGALGIRIVKGRNFLNLADTRHSILVNEAMVKHFGWDEPIGKRVKFPGDTSGNYLEVVGVFNDFNQKSLYNPIAPLLLFYGPNGNIIQLKINPANTNEPIAKVASTWKKYFPQLPFEYKFLDEGLNSQYAADQQRGKIFAALSIGYYDNLKHWADDFSYYDSIRLEPTGYPDYLAYKDGDAKVVQSWGKWFGKSKKTGETLRVDYVQFDNFNKDGKIEFEMIYGDFSQMGKN